MIRDRQRTYRFQRQIIPKNHDDLTIQPLLLSTLFMTPRGRRRSQRRFQGTKSREAAPVRIVWRWCKRRSRSSLAQLPAKPTPFTSSECFARKLASAHPRSAAAVPSCWSRPCNAMQDIPSTWWRSYAKHISNLGYKNKMPQDA